MIEIKCISDKHKLPRKRLNCALLVTASCIAFANFMTSSGTEFVVAEAEFMVVVSLLIQNQIPASQSLEQTRHGLRPCCLC